MATSSQRRNVAYGIGRPLYDLSPRPISSTSSPTTSDKAEIGTVWTNKTTNQGWILISVISGSATWTPITVNGGAIIDTGDLRIGGGLTITAGDLNLVPNGLGSVGTVTATDAIASLSDITAGRSFFVAGDEGTGIVGTSALTNVVDTTLGIGAGTALMKTGNPGNSSGWMKIYVGAAVRWIPYWTNISP